MPTTIADAKTVRSVQHSREDALDDLAFERLLEGSRRMKDYYENEGLVLGILLGRLGLRRGEAVHIRSEWVDRRDQVIRVPMQDKCTAGEDGGRCGYCRRLARQIADYNDDADFETTLDQMWMPKTDAAAREIPYGFSARAELVLERFFDRWNQWPYSAQAVTRRVERAAELSEGVDPDRISPHILRATAATHHVGRGLSMRPLMQLMGWSDPSVAEVYIQRSGEATKRELAQIHSR